MERYLEEVKSTVVDDSYWECSLSTPYDDETPSMGPHSTPKSKSKSPVIKNSNVSTFSPVKSKSSSSTPTPGTKIISSTSDKSVSRISFHTFLKVIVNMIQICYDNN